MNEGKLSRTNARICSISHNISSIPSKSTLCDPIEVPIGHFPTPPLFYTSFFCDDFKLSLFTYCCISSLEIAVVNPKCQSTTSVSPEPPAETLSPTRLI